MKARRVWLVLVLVAMVCTGLVAGCQKQKKVVVATDATWPPMELGPGRRS